MTAVLSNGAGVLHLTNCEKILLMSYDSFGANLIEMDGNSNLVILLNDIGNITKSFSYITYSFRDIMHSAFLLYHQRSNTLQDKRKYTSIFDGG